MTVHIDPQTNGNLRNAQTEGFIESFGITDYRFETIELSRIDIERSQRDTQARFEKINVETVQRYKEAAKRGATFPPLIVSKVRQRFVVIDGNHRTGALIAAGIKRHVAYILEPTNVIFEAMMYAANVTLNGRQLSDNEIKAHAVWLASEHGGNYPASTVAKMLNLSSSQVQVWVNYDRVTNIVPAAAKLTPTVTRAFTSITSPPVLTELVHLAKDFSLTRLEASRMVKEMKAAGSELGQLEYLASRRNQLATRTTKPIVTTKGERWKLAVALGQIMNLDVMNVAHDAKSQTMVGEISKAIVRLVEIQETLEAH